MSFIAAMICPLSIGGPIYRIFNIEGHAIFVLEVFLMVHKKGD
jgi:hypothetical protein